MANEKAKKPTVPTIRPTIGHTKENSFSPKKDISTRRPSTPTKKGK